MRTEILKSKIVNPSFDYKKSRAALLLLPAFCILFFGAALAPDTQFLIIKNASSFNRVNEVITIKGKLLNKENTHLFPLVKKGDKIFTTQEIDTDNDGLGDELLIEVSLAARSTDTLQISWVKKEALNQFKRLTNVQLSLRSDNDIPSAEINQTVRYRGFTQNIAKPFYQMEGPGIENDKVAFRSFFDYRNGKDIYGKIVDTPVLAKVGVGASWHQMQYWGKDILKVGNSLGAGALAVEENKRIYPLADADTTSFQVMYEGALQAAFKLDFKNWDVAGSKKNGSETISVTKGNFYYKNEIKLELSHLRNLVAGFANFGMGRAVYKKHNARFSSVSTYGKQADGTTTNLGLAIMFSANEYVENRTADTTSNIPNTSYVALKPSAKKAIYFFACWENTDRRYATHAGFEKYLEETANKLANPIQIKISNKK